MEQEKNTVSEVEEKEHYELTPEEATSLERPVTDAAGFFDGRRVLMILSIAFVVVVGGGLLFNVAKSGSKKKAAAEARQESAAQSPGDFLSSLRDRAANRKEASETAEEEEPFVPESEQLPAVTFDRPYTYPPPPQAPTTAVPPPPPSSSAGTNRQAPDPLAAAYGSSLVPRVEGRLFAAPQGTPQNQAMTASQAQGQNAANEYYQQALAARNAMATASPATSYAGVDPYGLQNNQENKQSFYDTTSGGGSLSPGHFLGENSLWIGTIIPGILETEINTDLPGNVLARVTSNVYDSQTGKKLLIPQGTILVAKYNSSVSYAQHRVQIVWDTLIRPDGFYLELEGMNSVDKKGRSGQDAAYSENWFEYLKAAGIITMFSLANSKMTAEAAKYTSESAASGIADANLEFVNQMGGNIVSRAMNIQPTLSVANGSLINIMLNKTIYLPQVADYPATQKYVLE